MNKPVHHHSPNSQGTVLHVTIQPKASKSEIIGLHGEPPRLKIRIAAPPVDGEANAELIRFLSKSYKHPKSKIHLIRGETSRNKDLLFEDLSVSDLIGRERVDLKGHGKD